MWYAFWNLIMFFSCIVVHMWKSKKKKSFVFCGCPVGILFLDFYSDGLPTTTKYDFVNRKWYQTSHKRTHLRSLSRVSKGECPYYHYYHIFANSAKVLESRISTTHPQPYSFMGVYNDIWVGLLSVIGMIKAVSIGNSQREREREICSWMILILYASLFPANKATFHFKGFFFLLKLRIGQSFTTSKGGNLLFGSFAPRQRGSE